VILGAALFGGAVAVLVLPTSAAPRLAVLVPRREEPGRGSARDLRRPTLAVLGAFAWWLLGGGFVGLGAGVGLALGAPVLLERLDAREEHDEQALALQLPLALDLVGACLTGGAPLAQALGSVAGALDGPAAVRLRRVAAALAVGTPVEEAFSELGDSGAAGTAARALRRAAESGAPVAAAVTRVADEARRTATSVARKRVRQAGIKAAAPITVCFLPAFLVLGTVPTVVAVTGPLLKAF
jgi:pilus assembly protein TadC